MPAVNPLSINDVIQVRINQRLYGQRLMNVLHYQCVNDPGTAIEANVWFAALHTILNGAGGLFEKLQACQSEDLTQEFAAYQRIWPTRIPWYEGTINNIGSYAEAAAYSNTAVSITKVGSGTGRHSIGRMQIGGLPPSVVTAGVVTDFAYIGKMNDVAAKLLDSPHVTSGVSYLDLRPVLYDAVDPTGVTDILSYRLQLTTRDMRRRTVGLGE